jgi:hypothetical protein
MDSVAAFWLGLGQTIKHEFVGKYSFDRLAILKDRFKTLPEKGLNDGVTR